MIVVKIGGSILANIKMIAKDLHNQQFVLVHGIGPQTDELCKRMGIPSRWVVSENGIKSRYTDLRTMEVFNMAASAENMHIVSSLQSQNINAIGLGGIIMAERKSRIKIIENEKKLMMNGDYTGKIIGVNTKALQNAVDNGICPVISPIAISENHELLNVNADRLAAFIAGKMDVDIIINLTDVLGVLDGQQSIIKKITHVEIDGLMKKNFGGIVMKLFAAREALDFGVKKILISSGLVERPIDNALSENCTVVLNE